MHGTHVTEGENEVGHPPCMGPPYHGTGEEAVVFSSDDPSGEEVGGKMVGTGKALGVGRGGGMDGAGPYHMDPGSTGHHRREGVVVLSDRVGTQDVSTEGIDEGGEEFTAAVQAEEAVTRGGVVSFFMCFLLLTFLFLASRCKGL